jgi:hypothetical protein
VRTAGERGVKGTAWTLSVEREDEAVDTPEDARMSKAGDELEDAGGEPGDVAVVEVAAAINANAVVEVCSDACPWM